MWKKSKISKLSIPISKWFGIISATYIISAYIIVAIVFCILYLPFGFTLNSYDVCFWESSPWTWDISFMIKWRLSGASAFSSLQILLQCTEGPRIRRVLELENSVIKPVILSSLISCLMFWESKLKLWLKFEGQSLS